MFWARGKSNMLIAEPAGLSCFIGSGKQSPFGSVHYWRQCFNTSEIGSVVGIGAVENARHLGFGICDATSIRCLVWDLNYDCRDFE